MVVHLVLDEIIPRHSTLSQIVTHNSTDNINKVMKYTLEQINIIHVTTSYYHPQGTSIVERFHITLHIQNFKLVILCTSNSSKERAN